MSQKVKLFSILAFPHAIGVNRRYCLNLKKHACLIHNW